MEIILGKLAGFCNGVQSAVENTEELLKNREKMYCVGELAHNRQVMEELEKEGLIVVDNIEDVKNNSEVIFRAHGMPKEAYEKAKEKKIDVHDFSCTRVKILHEDVENANKEGYYIFLLGEKTHPEVIGTESFAKDGEVTVLKSLEDIESAIVNFKKSDIDKLYICAQTTFSLKKFDDIVEEIKEKLKDTNVEIKINKSICEATELRQKETERLAKEVDFMVIIGGKQSSNTKKLFEISSTNCKRAIHIETKDELEDIDFSCINKVGVMAGASTPKKSIEEVIDFLNKRSK